MSHNFKRIFSSVGYIYGLALLLCILFGSYYYFIDFCPCSNNDIFVALKVASIPNGEKWINGFYGPGYTILATIFSPSLKVFAYLNLLSAIFAVFIVFAGVPFLYEKTQRFYIASALFAFFIFIFIKVRPNFTDGVFVYPYTAAIILVFWGLFKEEKIYNIYLISGFVLLSWCLLFRSHGLLLTLLLMPVLFFYRHGFKKVIKMKEFYVLMFFLILPFSLFQFYFYLNEYTANWQFFNFYKFIYGVNWYKLDQLIDSYEFQNKIFFWEDFFRSVVKGVRKDILFLIIFFGIYSVLFLFSKQRIYLYLSFVSFVYLLIIIPGWSRGVLPLYVVGFIGLLFYQPGFNRFFYTIGFCLVLTYGVTNLYLQIKLYRTKLAYAKKEIESFLIKNNIKSDQIFTDDYNLYLPSYNMLKVDNFRGWGQFHPVFKSDQTAFLKKEFGRRFKVVVAQKGAYLTDSLPFKGFFEHQTNVNKINTARHVLFYVQN